MRASCWIAAMGVGVCGAVSSADLMWSVDAGTDALQIVNVDTGGVVRTIGRLGGADLAQFITPVGMAVHPESGAIYVVNNSPASQDGLCLVDPGTGLATFLGGGANLDGAIAFDLDGVLYGQDFLGGAHLSTVNTRTGALTSLGGPALPRLFGLDYRRADGFLYGVASNASNTAMQVHRISRATGAIVATFTLPTSLGFIPGTLVFDGSGTMMVTNGSSQIINVDPDTGAVSNIRGVGGIFQGLGLIGCAEPAVQRFTGGSPFGVFFGGSTGDTVGWRFTVNEPAILTQFGLHNDTGSALPGIDVTHDVALWDASMTLLGSGIVSASSPEDGLWAWGSPTAVQLEPGTTYTLGALYAAGTNESYISGAATMAVDPVVNHLGAVAPAATSLGLTFPTAFTAGSRGRFGPNFLFAAGRAGVSGFTGGAEFFGFHGGAVDGDVVGFRFTVSRTVTVNKLGVWNQDTQAKPFDGLTDEHEIGIWAASGDGSTGTLLTSNRVGRTGQPIGHWTYAATAPAVLLPGVTYVIGAEYNEGGGNAGDNYISSPTSSVLGPEITHLGAVAAGAADLGFVYPTGFTSTNRGRFGPNFIYSVCPCVANLTADCATNTNDFFQFLALYQVGDPRADFSPGGGINTNDFFAYLAAYQMDQNNPACPG